MKNNSGFTLVEVLISVALTGMILVAGYSAFQGIMASQAQLTGSIDIQRNLFYLNEKITSLIQQGGTIDYEEYFNRNKLGYARGQINNLQTYTALSKYGNHDQLYLCQVDSTTDDTACLGNSVVKNSSGTASTLSGQQKYGQYEALALNHGSILGFPTPNKLPPILSGAESGGLPELYLIKKLSDNSYQRTYFRHVFTAYPDITCDFTNVNNCLGKLQMTKLVSCDNGTADGIIDTWIPDPDFGDGDCTDPLATALNDLQWVDITSPDISVKSAVFLPAPLKIPRLMSGSGEDAIAPIIQIRLEVALSDLRQQKALAQGTDTRVLMSTIHLHE